MGTRLSLILIIALWQRLTLDVDERVFVDSALMDFFGLDLLCVSGCSVWCCWVKCTVL